MTSIRLEPSQRQELRFTLAMQQAVALLVMSTLELQQHIQQELATNPALEATDEEETPPDEPAEAAPAEEVAAGEEEPAPETPAGDESSTGELDYENLFAPPTAEARGNSGGEDVENPIEETASEEELLSDHLMTQLSLLSLAPELAATARLVVFQLDQDGFLGMEPEAFAAANRLEPALARKAVELVRSLDPPGVAARDARESLLIQLTRQGQEDSVAGRIIRDHFDDLAKNRLPAIAKALNLDIVAITAAIEMIRTLEPWPGRAFGPSETSYIIPDVIVEKVNGEYVVTLRNDRLPQIRINREYLRMFDREKRAKSEVGRYLKGKLDAAFLLIKSIEMRQTTLYRVAEAIVKRQRDFFEYGIRFLKPLTLKEVAEDLDIHESTVSRVTTQKFMQSPQGVFELKFFFTSGLATDSGENASARSVKSLIRELVEQEDAKHPLSDQDLANRLAVRGIHIARRTVTKYREQLEIASASQRVKY